MDSEPSNSFYWNPLDWSEYAQIDVKQIPEECMD